MEHLLAKLPGEPRDGGRSKSIATKTT